MVKQAPAPDTTTVIAAGQAVRPLSLAPMVYAVPSGKGVEYIEVGVFCLPAAKHDRDKEPSLANPSTQQILLSFIASSLESRGYVVDESAQAPLALASEFIAYTASTCFPYLGLGNNKTGTGEVWIEIRWVLTDRSTGTVLLDKTTEGTTRIPENNNNLHHELWRRSVDQATANLANDPAFIALFSGTVSAAAAPTTAGAAPAAPSTLSQAELDRAQTAFDTWLADNRNALAQAMSRHLSDLAVKPVVVTAVQSAKVRDVTGEGYIVELSYSEDQRDAAGLFLVALNSGQLQRVQKLQ